jgi:hypothetical protein
MKLFIKYPVAFLAILSALVLLLLLGYYAKQREIKKVYKEIIYTKPYKK